MTATPPETPAVPPVVPTPPVAAAPAAPPVAPPPAPDNGFPANTPIADMTIEQQAAYWKHHARQHENTVKARQDYDALKAKADEFDRFQAANATEHEKAIKAAADTARAEAIKEATPRIVTAHFHAAAAGRLVDATGNLDTARLNSLLEPLDLTKFVDAKGEVDSTKVATFIDSIAPKAAPNFPDMGQGRREGGAGPSVAAGRELFESQQKKPPTP